MEKKGGGARKRRRGEGRGKEKRRASEEQFPHSLNIQSSPSRSWSQNRGHLPQLSCPHPGVHFWWAEFTPQVRVRGYGSISLRVDKPGSSSLLSYLWFSQSLSYLLEEQPSWYNAVLQALSNSVALKQ